MGPNAFKNSMQRQSKLSTKKYRDVVQMDLNSLISGQERPIEDIEELSSKMSSYKIDHEDLLE
jgi:hypothetical protein